MPHTVVTALNEQLRTKQVKYTGSDTLKKGYLVCYDRNNTTALDENEGAIGADSASYARHEYVEKPATGNLQDFAGVVLVPPDADGWMTIVVPEAGGTVCEVFTDQDCTINSTTLHIDNASYYATNAATGVSYKIGKALQTVDRSSTAGLVQALIFPIHVTDATD